MSHVTKKKKKKKDKGSYFFDFKVISAIYIYIQISPFKNKTHPTIPEMA